MKKKEIATAGSRDLPGRSPEKITDETPVLLHPCVSFHQFHSAYDDDELFNN
jgi:hypothetical protein